MTHVSRLFSVAMLSALLGSIGCTAPTGSPHRPGGGDGDVGGESGDDPGSSSTGSGDDGSGSDGATVSGTIGVVVIDVQETFVSGASTPDMAGVIDRTKSAFELAEEREVPFFITFEASQQGDHALHAPLVPFLPTQAERFTKTTFAATGLPAFVQAVQDADLTHVVVLGAETDVCVLQTVLGLRELGLTVLVEGDAVFTEETNPSPALRRLQQAGAYVVDLPEITSYLSDPSVLPAPKSTEVRITSPLQIGVVLNAFTDTSVDGNSDPHVTQKSARLRELLMISEWFELPVYADASSGLPSTYQSYFHGQLRPLDQIGADASVTQLVIAGTDGDLSSLLPTWMSGHEVFVMEDALLALGTPAAQVSALQPHYEDGLVPTTYKSFYYDMTKSVDESQWPSQSWVDRFDDYYWLTAAPEDLPPIPPG